IWERGVGWTSASGTSACAVVAAAVKTGLIPFGRVAVRMEGGVMEVELDEDWAARLHGPVEEVCEGVLAGGIMSAGCQLRPHPPQKDDSHCQEEEVGGPGGPEG
ncbi:MAG: hypothetical protein F4187_02515, partial [Gemmatimonadetes bacterium]|nr:hypothetical protein [Gemmatimonadota bacterium]